MPTIHPTAFVHPLAFVAGEVTLGPRVSLWPFVSVRGDSNTIEIGEDSNVQDGSVIHVDDGFPRTEASRRSAVRRARSTRPPEWGKTTVSAHVGQGQVPRESSSDSDSRHAATFAGARRQPPPARLGERRLPHSTRLGIDPLRLTP